MERTILDLEQDADKSSALGFPGKDMEMIMV